jgi:thioredoxin-like negative regulator of GroEL
MPERTEAELKKRSDDGGAFAVFLYTPLCGTCKVSARMLEIVQVMRPQLTVDRANVNFMPQLVKQWKVESVPCLIRIEQGTVVRKLYAFESVENVDRFLEPLYADERTKSNEPE